MFSKTEVIEEIQYPEIIDQIINEYCPETGDENIVYTYYKNPAQVLYDYLANCPATPGAQGDIPTRFEWQLRLAGESLRTIEGLSLQKYINLTGSKKWHWHRAAWNRALFWGLGELIKTCQIYKGVDEIDLLKDVIPNTDEEIPVRLVLRSVRDKEFKQIHTMALEYELVQRISPFPYAGNGDIDRIVWLHTQNSYWQFNTRNNPIVRILELAVPRAQSLLTQRTPHEMLTVNIAELVQSKSASISTGFLPGAEVSKTNKEIKPNKPRQALTQTVIEMPKPDVAAGYQGKDPITIKLSQWIEQGELKINCSGSSLHITSDNHVGVTYPKGIEQLALMNAMSSSDLMKYFEDNKLMVDTGQRYFFNLPKTKNKDKQLPIAIILLDKSAMSSFVQHIEPNPIIINQPKD